MPSILNCISWSLGRNKLHLYVWCLFPVSPLSHSHKHFILHYRCLLNVEKMDYIFHCPSTMALLVVCRCEGGHRDRKVIENIFVSVNCGPFSLTLPRFPTLKSHVKLRFDKVVHGSMASQLHTNFGWFVPVLTPTLPALLFCQPFSERSGVER